MDRYTLIVLVGMFFCMAGTIGSYLIVGVTFYLFIAVLFIITACSLIVGIFNKGEE